jgi:hypothetical protein
MRFYNPAIKRLPQSNAPTQIENSLTPGPGLRSEFSHLPCGQFCDPLFR